MTGRVEFIGPAGIGKTTLLAAVDALPDNFRRVVERLEPIARDRQFWSDSPAARAYFIQSVYYTNAYRQFKLHFRRSSQIAVSDFSILVHHHVYSQVALELGQLSAIEFRRLHCLLQTLERSMPPLLAVVACKADSASIVERIRHRGRAYESFSLEYITRLSEACECLLSRLRVPIIVADLNAPVNAVATSVSRSLREVVAV